jgi:hypothetical protein
METKFDFPNIVFPNDFDERSELEMPMRGYLSHAFVEDKDGTRYSVYFIDPVRLQQDLEQYIKLGVPCLAEPGLIVLSDVTIENIKRAVNHLWKEGFFSHLKPLNP